MKHKVYFLRKALCVLSILVFSCAEGQTPIPYSSPSLYAGNYTSGNHVFYGVNAVVQNLNISNNANYEIKANKSIRFTPLSSASTLSTGSLHAYIDPYNVLDIASFHPNGWSNIPKYEKFEIGINLPYTVSSEIVSFLSASGTLNPYDPEKFKIKCTYVSSTNKTYVRYGFHYKGFNALNDRWVEQVSNWTNQLTQYYGFRIRFAPPEEGLYKCKIEIYKNNILQTYKAEFEFIAVNNTTNPIVNKGHLKMANEPGNNYGKMKYENNDPYFGMGRDIPYVENVGALNDLSCLGVSTANCTFTNGNLCLRPTEYDRYRSLLTRLADNGGNFVRIRLDPQLGFPIEWAEVKALSSDPSVSIPLNKCLNNYFHNQKFMGEFDKCIDLCEARGLKIMLNILDNSSWEPSSWPNNPYSTLWNDPDSQEIHAFFSDETAKANFKKLLFYIMARWGYSTSIAMWEFINETENLLDYQDTITAEGPQFRQNVANWICDMKYFMETQDANYVFYPWHPFTTGTIYDPTTSPLNVINFMPCGLNVYSYNDYRNFSDAGYFQNSDDWRHKEEVRSYNAWKPFIRGEIGLGQNNHIEFFNDRNFHNSIWTSAMGGSIGTSLNWHNWNEPFIDHVKNFKAMKAFFDNVDWSAPLIPDRKSFYYPPSQSWLLNQEISGTKSIYNYYMKRQDANYIIGWCMNGSSHWAVDPPSSFYWPAPPYDDLFTSYCNQKALNPDPEFLKGLDCSGPTLSNYDCLKALSSLTNTIIDYDVDHDVPIIIRGVNYNTPYLISIYKTYENGGLIEQFSQYSAGTNLIFTRKLKNHITGDGFYPDYAYMITAIGSGQKIFSPNNTIAGTENAQLVNEQPADIKVFPNPASDAIFLTFNKNAFDKFEVQLLNETGQIVYSGKNETRINVRALTEGFYFLKFTSGSFMKTLKISIVH